MVNSAREWRGIKQIVQQITKSIITVTTASVLQKNYYSKILSSSNIVLSDKTCKNQASISQHSSRQY